MRGVERALLGELSRQAGTQDEEAALLYCSQQSREADVSLGPLAGMFTSSDA